MLKGDKETDGWEVLGCKCVELCSALRKGEVRVLHLAHQKEFAARVHLQHVCHFDTPPQSGSRLFEWHELDETAKQTAIFNHDGDVRHCRTRA